MDYKGGLILGICVIAAASVLAFAIRTSATIPPSEVGRYQFAGSSGVNVFVLDTKTGRIWQRFVDSSGGPTEWSENRVPWVESSGK